MFKLFRRKLKAACYIAKRIIIQNDVQRFAPSGRASEFIAAPPEQGSLDSVRFGVVSGWARCIDCPDYPVEVDVYGDGWFLGRTEANIYRPDLAREPGFEGARYGFLFSIDRKKLTDLREVSVFAARSGFELRGSPLPANLNAQYRGDAVSVSLGDQKEQFEFKVVTLDEMRKSYGSRLKLCTEREPSAVDSGFVVSRLMHYVNVRFYDRSLSYHGRDAYLRLLIISADHFKRLPAGLPLSEEQVEKILVPTGSLCSTEIHSNYLMDFYIRETGISVPTDRVFLVEFLYGFCVNFLLRYRLPIEFIGYTAINYIVESGKGSGLSSLDDAFKQIQDQSKRQAEDMDGVNAQPSGAFGIEIISASESFSALSINARQSALAFKHLGISTTISIAPQESANDKFHEVGGPSVGMVLLHMQPDEAVEAIIRMPKTYDKSHMIGFFMWETERLPAAHQLGALLVDEIWTASDYCKQAFNSTPATPISVVGHAVEARPAIEWDARAWSGIDADSFLFLFHFDAHSWITRKNPIALLRAFKSAFETEITDVRLVIKVRHEAILRSDHWSGWWAELLEEAEGDLRIKILTGDLSSAQIDALVKSCDAYASLHRAEGFGYGIAEAMLAGKPVIVSEYSGNMEFCTDENAILVPVERRRVGKGEFLYGDSSQIWGNPNWRDAAKAMARLYADRDLCRRLGENGRKTILEKHSLKALAQNYAEAMDRRY